MTKYLHHRECKKCKNIKELVLFVKSSKTAYRKICKECFSIRQKKYREIKEHKDKAREYRKHYYETKIKKNL
jgi:hypothetical protein